MTSSDTTAVVSCFNYGRFLPEAVASLLEQDGGPPRVIVVDDGSTDPLTVGVLGRLPDEVEVVCQANAGVAAARNAGLARADTPYMLFLDADDRLAPGALAALRGLLASEPDVGYAYGLQRYFGDRSGVIRFPPFNAYHLLYRHTIGPTALVRRGVLEATGGYDPAFLHMEDWEIWVHALAHGFVGRRLETVTHEYRAHGPSKLREDRRQFRHWVARLREKHAGLYARAGELARTSGVGPVERAVYRWFWGERPIPVVVERAAASMLWRPRSAGEDLDPGQRS